MFDNDNGVVHVAAFYQALAGEELYLVEEHEGAAGTDGGCIVRVKVPAGALNAQDPGSEINSDFSRRLVRRLDPDPCSALFILDFHCAGEFEEAALCILRDYPGLAESLDVGECAAVQNGNLGIVDADLGIVDAHSRQG